jgi:uncharacterized protein
MATTHLLYLHGFRSSPQSFKAQRMHALLARRAGFTWWCPQVPLSPKEVIRLLRDGTTGWPRETMAVVGSSLGGFYATCMAEQTGCRAVLLNPAVHPARDLVPYVGDLTAFHDPSQHLHFAPEFIDELRDLERGPITQPERYFAVIARGDEVLDWREMAERYPGAHIKLLEGSDHALSDFDEHLPDILEFLGLA